MYQTPVYAASYGYRPRYNRFQGVKGGALGDDDDAPKANLPATPYQSNNPIGTDFWPARLLGKATPTFVYTDLSDFLMDSPKGLPTGQKYINGNTVLPVSGFKSGDGTPFIEHQLAARSLNPFDKRLVLVQANSDEEYINNVKVFESGALTEADRSAQIKNGGSPLRQFLEGINLNEDIYVVQDFSDMTSKSWIANSYWYDARYTFDDAELIVYSASPFDLRTVALPYAYKNKLAKIAQPAAEYVKSNRQAAVDEEASQAKQNLVAKANFDAAAAARAAANAPKSESMSPWEAFKTGFVGAVKVGLPLIPKIF
jgi:hypothetical protein